MKRIVDAQEKAADLNDILKAFGLKDFQWVLKDK